tara:strand:+ start:121 stop:681 length:561 start_codon:yes stop_codon:yes gene_type:complete
VKFEKIHNSNINTGCVIWITGLSGAGKTTLSKDLGNRLKKIGIPCLLLDGDIIRSIFSEDKDNRHYTYESRKRMAIKYSRLSLILASQGYCVITSVIGMFKEIYSWNKKYLPGYYEIFLDIPICELKKRDPKGIYRKFSLGKINNVAGLDLKIQKPTDPDLHITDCKAINTETIISHVINRFSTSV